MLFTHIGDWKMSHYRPRLCLVLLVWAIDPFFERLSWPMLAQRLCVDVLTHCPLQQHSSIVALPDLVPFFTSSSPSSTVPKVFVSTSKEIQSLLLFYIVEKVSQLSFNFLSALLIACPSLYKH